MSAGGRCLNAGCRLSPPKEGRRRLALHVLGVNLSDGIFAGMDVTLRGNGRRISHKEYLIYDGVALISAIGGTLGLCIGFSFYDVGTKLMSWLELGTNSKRVTATSIKPESKGDVKNLVQILTERMGALESKMATMESNNQ